MIKYVFNVSIIIKETGETNQDSYIQYGLGMVKLKSFLISLFRFGLWMINKKSWLLNLDNNINSKNIWS